MAARKRRHQKGQGQLEDDLLKNTRWSGLREQQRLQQRFPPERNQRDREACRKLVNEGFGSDAAFLTWLYGQKKDGIRSSGIYRGVRTGGFRAKQLASADLL